MANKTTKTTKSKTAPKTAAKSTSSRSRKPATTAARKKETTTAASRPKTTPVKTAPKTTQPESAATSPRPSVRVKKSYVITGVVLIALAVLLYLVRGLFVAAVVNGQPISRLSVIQELEREGGKQILSQLVTNKLIEEEAAKEHVTVSDSEVNKEFQSVQKSVTSQGQNFNDVLATQGLTQDTLKDRIRVRQLLDKMIAKKITVTDKEAQDYYNKNKSTLPPGSTVATAKQDLMTQKEQSQEQSFLANLQKNAKINYYVNY